MTVEAEAPAGLVVDEVLGSVTPRIFTPPLVSGPAGPCGCGCALTPDTSYGFAVVDFAEERLGRPLFAWQRWLVIHAGELTALGLPRFRRIVVVVGRQSGKTVALETLALYWLFEDQHPSILGTSTLAKYAKRTWMSAFKLAADRLADDMPENPHRKAIRKTTGEEEWWTLADCHYGVAASNAEGGRSMSNQRVIADELAKQYNYDAYSAAYYSMDAFEDAQYWGLTTPDAKGVVFNDLRGAALEFIESGEGDPTLALFEWSAPDDAAPDDLYALAAANPTVGRLRGKSMARMVNQARAAMAKGGELLRSFRTEVLCIPPVGDDDRPVNLEAWKASRDPGTLDDVRDQVVAVFDVAPSERHATLYVAAQLPDGRVRLEPVKAWDGLGCVDLAVRELPGVVARVKPRAFGWFPVGPGASAAARLRTERRGEWPPRGVTVQELRGELSAVCMGFGQLVAAGKVAHSGDPLLDDDVQAAQKLARSNGSWVFSRMGEGDCDALYAASGAAYLAQTLPSGLGRPRVLLPRSARR